MSDSTSAKIFSAPSVTPSPPTSAVPSTPVINHSTGSINTSDPSICRQLPQNGSDSLGAGALAGVAIGCLIVGGLLASFILTLFMTRRYRSKLEMIQNRWEAEREAFGSNENTKALYYVSSVQRPLEDPVAKAKIEEANKKIKQLEQERNAASQFGDTLDRHSEQDLLTSSAFGLYTFDQILKQAVIALSVNSSGTNQPAIPSIENLTCCSPKQLAFLRLYDLKAIQANFENVLLHLINGFLYEKVCNSFSPYTEANQDELFETIHKALQASYDQGVVARWRCLTQKALRSNQGNKAGMQQSLTRELSNLIVQVLVWSGMDDSASAKRNVKQNNHRLNLAIGTLLSLLDIMHEEMSSSNYGLLMAERDGLTKTFGMIANNDQKSRIIAHVTTV